MIDPLYLRYEEELGYIRNEVRNFAAKYPLAASRLLLENDSSADPHVERLIESFALLSARIRTKIDDEFPELIEGLVNQLYPHFTRPIPSMCTVGFEIDPKRARIPYGVSIPSGTKLDSNAPDGDRIHFQTALNTRIWPIRTVQSRVLNVPTPSEWGLYQFPEIESVIHLRIEIFGGLKWHELEGLNSLRFFIRGNQESSELLIDTILSKSLGCFWISPASKPNEIRRLMIEKSLEVVGFEPEDAILPCFEPDLWPYRLLTEYMAFPSKFHYLDVPFPSVNQLRSLNLDNHLDLVFGLKNHPELLQKTIHAETFTLGCTPAINLFHQTAEPIRTNPSRYSYQIVPDVAHPYTREVYHVDSVTWSSLDVGTAKELSPFMNSVWETNSGKSEGYWHTNRSLTHSTQHSLSEVSLAIVTNGFEPMSSDPATLVVRTLCSNGDLPFQTAQMQGSLTFSISGSSLPFSRIVNLDRLTPSFRSRNDRGLFARLLSQLKLNSLSMSEGKDSIESLKAILRLYIPSESAISSETRQTYLSRVNALESIQTNHFLHRMIDKGQSLWVRGIEFQLLINPDVFAHEGGLVLWGSLINHFLGLNLSINSLMKLKLVDFRSKSLLFEFPIRSGEVPPT